MLQKTISNEAIFKIIQKKIFTQFETNFKSSRVLVLSPHPDDETFGCAGAILQTIAGGGRVKVVQFTDGSSGFPKDFHPTALEKKQMSLIREKEMNEAKELLGISEVVLLGYRDGKLTYSKSLVNFLKQVIKDYNPTAVFVPSFLDPASDHSEVARIFYLSAKKITSNTEILQYEIWSPLQANFYLNIDKEFDTKVKAMNLYKSQLKSRNYTKAIEGLNRYRGSIYGNSEYAEGYLRTDLETFKQLAELVF